MEIVIDSNILFSALIKKSTTRKLIIEYKNKFLFPEYIFTEFINHRDYLLMKSNMEKCDFEKLLELILNKVEIISNNKIKQHIKEAKEIVSKIDPNDALFIATALKYKNSILWSDDKKLKLQNKVKVLNTKEIIEMQS